MKIEKHRVVAINYTLTDTEGNVIDTSEGRGPLQYIHGMGNLISGLEEKLEGKEKGDALDVSIDPEKGYGVRDEALLQTIPKDRFPSEAQITIGMQLQGNTPEGPIVVSVVEVTDTAVVVDANHPLAGVVLNFNVEVIEVRQATLEEIQHGHVHGPGGHEH